MSITFTPALKREYEALFAGATIRSARLAEVDAVADRICVPSHWGRYQQVEQATGVPAHVVGILHIREAGGDFAAHLHNGDKLTARTHNEPPGRPLGPIPPGGFTFLASAIDALTMEGQALDKWHDWSIAGICFVLERYNGFGNRIYHKINSPYLWGYTSVYESGMYVADGVWSATAVNRNPGGMAILKRMIERGLIPPRGTASSMPPMPPQPGEVHPILRRGSRGAAVGELQRRLVALGYDPGPVDEDYGSRTETAVSAFQAARQVMVPGTVGRSTWNEIAYAEAERR